MKKKPIRAKRVIITAIAAAFPVITICIASLSLALFQDAKPVKRNSKEIFPKEISVGYNESSDSNSKELPPQLIALKCMSFYEHGEKIVVDAAMGDLADSLYQYQDAFKVYLSDDISWENACEGILSINGEFETFEKIFDKEDMMDLNFPDDIPMYGAIPISKYPHHENIELDFSNFNVGDSGWVIFSLGWDTCSGTSIMRRALYFYIGKNGIAISFNDVESAEEEYENYCGEPSTLEQRDVDNTLC